jgi:hypothetical protein
MKTIFLGAMLMASLMHYGQSKRVEWKPDYTFTLSDFENPGTRIDSRLEKTLLQPGILIELGFQMSGVEFMFTRNFNEKVTCLFDKGTAIILAQNQIQVEQMLQLAAFDFDLSELYARKIRKALFENKKTFSEASFFKPIYDRLIAERNTISSRVYLESDFGILTKVLEQEHATVKAGIEELAEYCKNCKPPKKKQR